MDKVDKETLAWGVDLLLVLQRFCHLCVNSDSIDIEGSGFSEELNQACHLLRRKTQR